MPDQTTRPTHRPTLTRAQWLRIGTAVNELVETGDGRELRHRLARIIRPRLAEAWEQGRRAGWDAGVADANDTRPPRVRNPYTGRADS